MDTTVLSGTTDRAVDDTPSGVTMRRIGRDVAQSAVCEYVVAAMTASRSDADMTERARDLVDKPATILRHGATMLGAPSIMSGEGRIFRADAESLAFVPKGKRTQGIRCAVSSVLGIEPGYGKAGIFEGRVSSLVGTVPVLANFGADDLAKRCPLDADAGRVQSVAFGTAVVAGHRGPGSLWFITGFDAESGIVDGFLRISDDSDLCSEHGSIMVGDLSDRFGLVAGYPGGLTMADAFAGADNTDEEVLEMLRDLPSRG